MLIYCAYCHTTHTLEPLDHVLCAACLAEHPHRLVQLQHNVAHQFAYCPHCGWGASDPFLHQLLGWAPT
jgi:NMD protein affecting ribosome stability and mRNA decay